MTRESAGRRAMPLAGGRESGRGGPEEAPGGRSPVSIGDKQRLCRRAERSHNDDDVPSHPHPQAGGGGRGVERMGRPLTSRRVHRRGGPGRAGLGQRPMLSEGELGARHLSL